MSLWHLPAFERLITQFREASNRHPYFRWAWGHDPLGVNVSHLKRFMSERVDYLDRAFEVFGHPPHETWGPNGTWMSISTCQFYLPEKPMMVRDGDGRGGKFNDREFNLMRSTHEQLTRWAGETLTAEIASAALGEPWQSDQNHEVNWVGFVWRYAKQRIKKLDFEVILEEAYPASPGAEFGVMPTTDAFRASSRVIELLLADPQVARQLVGIPKSKIPGVQSLASLMARMTMWDQQQWLNHDPHVLNLRALTTKLLATNDFTPATIMNLVARLTRMGLSSDEAHHLPIEEAARRLEQLEIGRDNKTNQPMTVNKTPTARAIASPSTVVGLDFEEHKILKELRRVRPLLLTIVELKTRTKISMKTVGKRLANLIRRGLACRPNGDRAGATITDEGSQLLGKTGSKVTR